MMFALPSSTSVNRARPARRRAALVLACLLAVPASVPAQKASGPQPSPELQQRLAQAKERLQLTSEQEARLRTLLQEEAQKLRAVRDKYAGDTSLRARGARSREARVVQEDFRTRLQGLLSAVQLDDWDQMGAEARAQARERRQQPR